MKPSSSPFLFGLLSILLLVSSCSPAPTTTVAQPTATPPPTASPLSGALNELSGTVDTKQADEAAFHAAAAGDVLKVNGQVQTGEDGRVRIDLSSGTIIRVVPSSLFTLVSNETAEGGLVTKLKLELGRIFIILSGGSMDVETPSGVASVRGSYMMVEVNPVTQDVVVTCLEGDCSAGGVDFTDGQKITFPYDPATGKYGPPQLGNMTEEDFQKWLDANPEVKQIVDQVLAGQPQPTATLVTILPPSGPTEASCFNLTNPLDGAILGSIGLVTFEWETQTGAENYRVVFTSPGGVKNVFETAATSLMRYIESLQGGGQYSWEVTALDANGEPICTANAFTFSKLVSPTATSTPKGKEELTCTSSLAQWSNPNAPCYCDPNSYNNPPYCSYGGY